MGKPASYKNLALEQRKAAKRARKEARARANESVEQGQSQSLRGALEWKITNSRRVPPKEVKISSEMLKAGEVYENPVGNALEE